ncbi:hydrolase TatD [Tyzzerella sp. An114]|uniref:Qat anti-phage system TatD family nuclease QatD n=1 Tax=Tyzzerella sp. An114 TaxID=1965545 RepID=UPI000B44E627|nr:Qat anti-phage system TatD family nuclease QatD [Tyzzerella sp. An114]OUQ55535.1 hydrolase TatD [Tyzzerella sp. An114]
MTKFNMDAHMHFDLYKNRQDVLNYIEENKSYTIAVTNLPDLYKRYYGEDWNYKYIRLALGFHPELVSQYEDQIDIFKDFLQTTRFIGEVGLDYSIKSEENRKKQREVFRQIVNLCQKDKKKIVSVHSRRAESDCLSILYEFEGKVILHWYTGSLHNLATALSRGYYFSINQQMIKNQNGRNIIDKIPIERIILESDAPFTVGLDLNYNLVFVNELIAYLSLKKNIDKAVLYMQIKDNFRKLLL